MSSRHGWPRSATQKAEYKNGSYYVLTVETTFGDKGASRIVTIGKRIESNG